MWSLAKAKDSLSLNWTFLWQPSQSRIQELVHNQCGASVDFFGNSTSQTEKKKIKLKFSKGIF